MVQEGVVKADPPCALGSQTNGDPRPANHLGEGIDTGFELVLSGNSWSREWPMPSMVEWSFRSACAWGAGTHQRQMRRLTRPSCVSRTASVKAVSPAGGSGSH